VYHDDFHQTKQDYDLFSGDVNEEGERLVKNTESNGRFHSDWCSMIYSRLMVARNLLTEDGIIFISINDCEIDNLKKIVSEVFGEDNQLACFCWRTDGNFDNQARIKSCHEYILLYAKNEESVDLPNAIDPNIPKNSKIYKSEIRNTIIKNGIKNPIEDVVIPKGFPSDISDCFIEKSKVVWPQYS
jgi:adenine-specific DNA-methyltransferase